MRFALIAAASSIALIASAAQAQDPAMPAAPAAATATVATGAFTDAELAQFAGAMEKMKPVSDAVQGGAPTAEQQAQMAAVVQGSGLDIARFNAISTAASSDPVVRARIAVATTPASAPGSVGAAVTDAEAGQFAQAMAKVQPIAEAAAGAAPTPEQQAQMAAAIEASGLPLERFNAISSATAGDARLRARIGLAEAQAGGA